MKKKSFNGILKTIAIAVFIVISIIGRILSSLSLLKEEAIKTHQKIAELHATTITEQIYQTFNNTEFLINTIKNIIKNRPEDEEYLKEKLKNILSTLPYVRSINILNSKNIVILSTNKLNTGLYIDSYDFFPKPMFDKSILRFGNPWIGRDFISGIEVTKAETSDYNSSSFFPILKLITINEKEFYVLININSDYFINKYMDILDKKSTIFDLIRIDKMLLVSSESNHKVGSNLINQELFKNSLENNNASGIDIIHNKKYITAYHITPTYPLIIAIRMDFKKSLKEWEKKRENIVLIISSLVLISVILVIALIFKNKGTSKNLV